MVTQVTEDADTLIINVSLDLYTVIVIFWFLPQFYEQDRTSTFSNQDKDKYPNKFIILKMS